MQFIQRHFVVLFGAATILVVGLFSFNVTLSSAEFHSPVNGAEVIPGVFDAGIGGDGLGHAFVKDDAVGGLNAFKVKFPEKTVLRASDATYRWQPNSAANYYAKGTYVIYRVVK